MERTAFLARIRAALEEAEPVDLPAAFPATPATGTAPADPERFRTALAASNGVAQVVGHDEVADAVADIARDLPGSRRVVVATDVDPWWPAVEQGLQHAGAAILRPDPAGWVDQAAGADLGITSAILGVAATGSVLLVPGPDAPRLASLLPPVHLVILPVDRLVPGLEEALVAVAAHAGSSSAPVLVTGPSRTSDIEMTTVYGAHGPKAVHVLVVT